MSNCEKEILDNFRLDGHEYCIANEMVDNKIPFKRGGEYQPCGSSDALSLYTTEYSDGTSDYSAYCWSCSQSFRQEHLAKSSLADQLGLSEDGGIKEKKVFNKKPKQPRITREQQKALWERTDNKGYGYRGLSDESLEFYGFRIEHKKGSNEVKGVYFPETKDGKLQGYKSRHHDKIFGVDNIGITGAVNDLAGQVRFQEGGKYCVPMDTQILTKTGWKHYDQVEVGEIVLGYDQNTQTKKWTKITQKHFFKEDDVYEFGTGNDKLRSTKNHRWFIKQRKDTNGIRVLVDEVRTLEEFNSESRLIVNAPFETTKYDDFTKLELSTSKTGDFSEKILSMTHNERVAWLDGFLLADGHLREPKGGKPSLWEGAQNRGDIFDAVLLCSYLVHDKIIRVKNSKPNHLGNVMGKVVLSSSHHRYDAKKTVKWVSKEPVWCVTTELGSWVMKQGDTINITGNCLITGGEFDMVAAQDMLHEYQTMKNQDDYNRYAVVSPTTGESSAAKQCRNHYEWFDKFDVIVVGLDADEVGKEAALKLAEVLPKEKVRIATWSGGKDPNDMLQNGKQRQFWSDFFGAKELVASGITSSVNLMDSIREALKRPRIPLPIEMEKLQDMTKGDGLICNRIYNLIGDTSVGKSTFINIISHHLFFSENIKAGIVSLEASDGEYGADLLSYHLSQNLYWLEEDEALDYLDDPDVAVKAKEMLVDEYGESRFHVLDDRSGTWEGLKKRIEQLHRQYGCNVIIVDVLTDLLRTMGNEEQSVALNWMSNFVKNGVTIINVLHTRKPPSGRGGIPMKPTEYDVLGSSIFVQKAAGNIVIYRNKACTGDPIEQNTTYWDVAKMRQGKTGDKIMAMYYDGETRQVYDRDNYFQENPDKLPTGYDLSVSSFDAEYYEEGGRGWNGISKKGFGVHSNKKGPVPEPDIMDGVL